MEIFLSLLKYQSLTIQLNLDSHIYIKHRDNKKI